MPIYEYQCQSCGHELEKIQRMSDDPLSDCPDCGEAELRRLVSAAAFRLKGAGWYETDFKKGDRKNLHGADSSKPKTSGNSASDSSSSEASSPATSGNSSAAAKTGSKPASTKSGTD